MREPHPQPKTIIHQIPRWVEKRPAIHLETLLTATVDNHKVMNQIADCARTCTMTNDHVKYHICCHLNTEIAMFFSVWSQCKISLLGNICLEPKMTL